MPVTLPGDDMERVVRRQPSYVITGVAPGDIQHVPATPVSKGPSLLEVAANGINQVMHSFDSTSPSTSPLGSTSGANGAPQGDFSCAAVEKRIKELRARAATKAAAEAPGSVPVSDGRARNGRTNRTASFARGTRDRRGSDPSTEMQLVDLAAIDGEGALLGHPCRNGRSRAPSRASSVTGSIAPTYATGDADDAETRHKMQVSKRRLDTLETTLDHLRKAQGVASPRLTTPHPASPRLTRLPSPPARPPHSQYLWGDRRDQE